MTLFLLLLTVLFQNTPEHETLAVVTSGTPGAPNYYSVRIYREIAEVYPRPTREIWSRLEWKAEKQNNGDTEVVTSKDCEPLGDLARSFRDLPPLQPTPFASRVLEDELELPPVVIHGWGPRVAYKGAQGWVTIEARGDYAVWGNDVLSGLIRCWDRPLVIQDPHSP